MRVFITGGTGLVGSMLIDALRLAGHEVTVFTRNVAKAKAKLGSDIKYYSSLNSLTGFDDYDVIINLAGESIGGKFWTVKQRKTLCESRWEITRQLSALIQNSSRPPQLFISGSAIGYYGAQHDNILTEDSLPHNEFLQRLCNEWERLALQSKTSKTRVCILRTGIVLSAKGGMLPKLTLPFKWGLGAVIGTGRQYVSWIHIQDMINGILFLMNTPQVDGIFNFTAPNPLTNKEFSKILAHRLHRPCIFRIPALPIKLIMGKMSTLLIDGQRAIPKHLDEINYKFAFENIDEALTDLFLHRAER